MGFLKPTNTVRIDLAEIDIKTDPKTGARTGGRRAEYDGYWVDIKPQLSRAEKRGVERAMFSGAVNFAGSTDGAQVSGRMAPDMVGMQDALLIESIAGWNLTDENDQPLPTSPQEQLYESLSKLPDDVFDYLYVSVNAGNRGRTKEEQATFPGGADAGPESGEGRPAEPGQILDAGGPVAEVGSPA